MKIRSNIFDFLLIFFISLQIFGIIGGFLQPIRAFTLIMSPFTIFFFVKNRGMTNYYLYEILFFMVWISYSWISLLWAVDKVAGIKEISYLNVNFLGVLTLFYFVSKSNKPLSSIIKGWTILLLLTFPIALFEILFDTHLPMTAQKAGTLIGGIGTLHRFASVTFGNYNGYCVIIAYVIPFLLSGLLIHNNKFLRSLIWIVFLCSISILAMNGSRGAIICAAISLIMLLTLIKKNGLNKSSVIFFFICILIIFISFISKFFFLIVFRFSHGGVEDNIRLNIILKSIRLLFNYWFIGVGAGNFQKVMSLNYSLDIVAAHNLFLEVLVQYGVLIFSLFIGLFFRILKIFSKNKNTGARYIVITSLLMFPIVTIIDSGYLLGMSIWLFIASLYAVADNKYSF